MLTKESSPISEALVTNSISNEFVVGSPLIVEYKAIPIQVSHPTNPDTLLLLIALSDDSIFIIKSFISLQ